METAKLNIKQWAEDDRPRGKMMQKGASALSNAELLAILIGSGTVEESAVGLMKRVMADCDNRLKTLGRMSLEELTGNVEVWDKEGKLVGGLYGVSIGPAFFGESMFSLVPSASKIALIFLAKYFQQCGGKLIDCQFETPHLKSMGGEYISYDEYMDIIRHTDDTASADPDDSENVCDSKLP